MRRLKKFGLLLLFLFMVASTLLYVLQEKIIFLPTSLPQDYEYSFSEPFEEFFLESQDGARLNALHFKRAAPRGVILYFHGNAGDLSRWGAIATYFVKENFDVIIMDYRGYGKSTGTLGEQQLFSDAQLFYDYTKRHYQESDIIIYGRSLGGAIATELASKNTPRHLLLETPFYNLYDVAKDRFSMLPLKFLLKYRFPSNEYIQKVKAPIAIFHGTEDSVVSFESGKRLYEAAPGKKQFYTIDGGEHNNLIEYASYREALAQELSRTE